MAYSFQSNLNPIEFDEFVRQSPLSNIMQESSWAKVKDDWNPLLCGVYENNELKGCALLLCRPLLFGYQFGYIPRGPIMDYSNEALVSYMIESLYQLGKSMHLISIKFDPNLYQTFGIQEIDAAKQMRMDDLVKNITQQSFCAHRGYHEDMYDATQPRHQLCFYETPNILEHFPKKTREKVNAAFDYHIEIEEQDVSRVNEFHEMITYTEKRKGIVLRNADYFTKMMNAYEDHSVLLFAYVNHDDLIHDLELKLSDLTAELSNLDQLAHKKKEVLNKRITKIEKELDIANQDKATDGNRVLVSALLLIRDEQTTELLYSGLNAHYRQYYAPYALRYKAIEWAFRQGCKRFNFGGVQGTLDDGLFTFKSSFHPSIDVYIGEFDIVINSLLYHVMETMIPKLKQWKLKMARKGKQHAN